MNPEQYSDDEILAALNRRLAGVESQLPNPPAWQAGGRGARTRPTGLTVRSRHGIGALASLVLITAVAVVAVGFGLSVRNGSHGGNGTGVPSVTIVYRLVPPQGVEVTADDLDVTATILANRIAAWGAPPSQIVKTPPDTLSVTVDGITDANPLRARLPQTGEMKFVLLPRDVYGYVDPSSGVVVAGTKAVPSMGSVIDPSLPAQFDGRDLDRSKVRARFDVVEGWVVEFGFDAGNGAEFETWSGRHLGEYFALVLDGSVISAPYFKSAIAGGMGIISGNFNAEGATDLATILRYGTLPMPLEEVSFDGALPGTSSAPTASGG
jgi:preprotein translocase subunit SecD